MHWFPHSFRAKQRPSTSCEGAVKVSSREAIPHHGAEGNWNAHWSTARFPKVFSAQRYRHLARTLGLVSIDHNLKGKRKINGVRFVLCSCFDLYRAEFRLMRWSIPKRTRNIFFDATASLLLFCDKVNEGTECTKGLACLICQASYTSSPRITCGSLFSALIPPSAHTLLG